MRIQYMSDLHREFGLAEPDEVYHTNADVLILAGDIDNDPSKALLWADQAFEHVPIILYVMGNHEFYHRGTNVQDHRQKGRVTSADLCRKGRRVLLLDNDTVVVNDTMFIGTTLWSNLSPLAVTQARNIINDYSFIGWREENGEVVPFRAEHSKRMYDENVEFLRTRLYSAPSCKKVVITHHLPTNECVHERFRGMSLANEFYASELSDLMLDYKPDLWIHGHTHDSVDINVGSTRVVANPGGYLRRTQTGGLERQNPTFNPKQIVEM